MALRTRKYYGEQVLNQLKLPLQNRDDKIDIREVYVQMDNWVNEKAKMGWLDNMRLGGGSQVDDQFVTTFEDIAITDPAAKRPSYFQLPANYANLPDNQGIQDVYFMNNSAKRKCFDPVFITSFRDVAGMRSNMAHDNQGRLSGSPRNGNFYFDQGDVGATYGNCACRLVIKSCFDISDSAPYPIAGDIANQMVMEVTKYFLTRDPSNASNLRDNLDKP